MNYMACLDRRFQTTQSIINNLPQTSPANTGISSVEEAREIQKRIDFKHEVDSLYENILLKIETLRGSNTPEFLEVNNFMAEQMNNLLHIPINNEDDFDYVEWLFNNGDLRTEQEISAREKAINDSDYINSGQYETDCFINKLGWGGGGFILGFVMPLLAVEDLRNPGLFVAIGWLICGFFGCLFMLIGFVIASKLNIDNAESHNVPKNHPRYQHDRRELTLAGVSGIIAAGTIAHKASKTAKDIGNVDGWKEMK